MAGINGYMTWSGDQISFNNYGILNISDGNYISNDGVTNSSFNNMIGGIINVNATGTASLSDNGFLFNNHGTINVLSGVFNMFGSDGVHDGVYNISSGAEMGGTALINFTGTEITNNGIIGISNLVMAGTSLQTINGNGQISNFKIDNSAGVTITGEQSFTTSLDLLTGKLNAGPGSKVITNIPITSASVNSYVNGQRNTTLQMAPMLWYSILATTIHILQLLSPSMMWLHLHPLP